MRDFNSSSANPNGEEIIRDFIFGKYFNGNDKSIVVIFKHSIRDPIIEKIFFHVFKSVDDNSKYLK
jgi:hypothetical protein